MQTLKIIKTAWLEPVIAALGKNRTRPVGRNRPQLRWKPSGRVLPQSRAVSTGLELQLEGQFSVGLGSD